MPARYKAAPRSKFNRRKATKKMTKKRTKRSKYDESSRTLRTMLTDECIVEHQQSWHAGKQDQSRVIVNYNNTVSGMPDANNNQYFDMTKCPRWAEYITRYRKVVVHGVSVSYRPYRSNDTIEWREQEYATWEVQSAAPQTFNTVNNPNRWMTMLMKERPDYQARRSNQNWTKWFPLKKVLRKRSIDAAMAIGYPQSFYWHGHFTNRIIGILNNHDTGIFKVRWYVTFHDPKDPTQPH